MGISCQRLRGMALVAVLVASSWPVLAGEQDKAAGDLRALVENDWAAQETRLGRTAGSPASIKEALKRARLLLTDMRGLSGCPDLGSAMAELERLQQQANDLDKMEAADRLQLYRQVRGLVRAAALKNPLLAGTPIVFLKRNRFACQMLHEHIAYFNQYGGAYGGGVYVLEEPGRSLKIRNLVGDRLPEGCYVSLALDYHARTVYFAYAEKTDKKPAFGSADQRFYHLYALDLRKNILKQLTQERFDDTDPCPLPDGGLAFLSTRRGGFTRCNGPWESIEVYTLHRMDPGGENIRTLSYHETNEWHPSILRDGRIVYTRWDYVDRSAANYHGIWTTNSDGTNAMALFGSYTARINACYQPRAIPGSQRILFVAGAHHADVGGTLVTFNPSHARLDPTNGTDRFDDLDVLSPEICYAEGTGPDGGWPKSYFHSPWPLSLNYYLVSFGHGPIPGMSSGGKRDTTGIYYFDRFGNLELLYRDPTIACMSPIPLATRPIPPVLKGTLDPALGDEGEFLLSDVTRSNLPFPTGRPIRSLRIFQVFPKTTPTANEPRLGHANAEGARMLLGTVPVEKDGSAYFRVPARKPLYFQAVDDKGHAVQGMRSVAYLQPGERRSCVGCHQPMEAAPAARQMAALKRPPSVITPGPDGTRPFSYPLLVQPVLDRYCITCHDGSKGPGKSPLVLSGTSKGKFTSSYLALRPFLRWYEWGGASITGTVTSPGRLGADESRLLRILEDPTHKPHVRLPVEERERLSIWLDGNVPFYGSYDRSEQEHQLAGEKILPPRVQ